MNSVLLFIFTLCSSTSFLGIMFGADPYSSNVLILIFFFATLFFSLIGFFSFTGLVISRVFSKQTSFDILFRRGFLLSLLAVGIVILESLSVLNAGNVAAIFLLVVSMEMSVTYRSG